MATASPAAPSTLKPGVAPLRAGQGTSFFLRRLHSLTGIIPVGAFLFEHLLISNAAAIGGPTAYAHQVRFLPAFRWFWRWRSSASGFPSSSTDSTASTSGIAARPASPTTLGPVTGCTPPSAGPVVSPSPTSSGTPGRCASPASTSTSRRRFLPERCSRNSTIQLLLAFYIVGLIAASWHFAYGIWLFCAKWGIVSGEAARRRFLRVCLAFFLLMSVVGLTTLYTMRSRFNEQPVDPVGARIVEDAKPSLTE